MERRSPFTDALDGEFMRAGRTLNRMIASPQAASIPLATVTYSVCVATPIGNIQDAEIHTTRVAHDKRVERRG